MSGNGGCCGAVAAMPSMITSPFCNAALNAGKVFNTTVLIKVLLNSI